LYFVFVIIIYYLLFIIYLLFTIYYLLFTIYYLLFIIYYLLFIIYYLLFIIYCLLFILPSDIFCRHLGFNMIAFWSFGREAASILGPDQFLGFYISAGLASALLSHLGRIRSLAGGLSLGASGVCSNPFNNHLTQSGRADGCRTKCRRVKARACNLLVCNCGLCGYLERNLVEGLTLKRYPRSNAQIHCPSL
jgi:hypothetical protein